ncbi:MAG: hypothetical protein ACXVRN_13910, partial [Solirubrobacteraceae bacterium]
MTLFSRARREQEINAAFADTASVREALGDVEVPPAVAAWLGRLHTLSGVPFGYLVPDEQLLPPESIRFFRINENWIRALLDGAFSLGRNLTTEAGSPGMNLDRAVFGTAATAARDAAPLRPRTIGPAPVLTDSGASPWTGFLLRSRVLSAYPGLGVNVYPAGHTPDDPDPALLPIRRLDRLGPNADTLLCIVGGDAYRVDVHEAPELLHFGIDSYEPNPGGAPAATKELHPFSRAQDGTVTVAKATVPVPVGASFRTRS